jgi:glutathione S-transferase
MPEARKDEYQAKLKAGYRALELMEQHLKGNDFLVDNNRSIADISLFAYTHVATEGGFELSDFPAIKVWIARIQSLEGFISMAG